MNNLKCKSSGTNQTHKKRQNVIRSNDEASGDKKDLLKQKAPIYAFFNAEPEFEFADDGAVAYLMWKCMHCGEPVQQGMKTKDKGLTGNMSSHARKCWGEEVVTAMKDSTLDKARSAVKKFGKKSQTRLTATLKMFKGSKKMVVQSIIFHVKRPLRKM
ncbi:hypothetical protein BT96DRAFT_946696 [Gymnopus androsaceus JB14]|uniref:BED-type domain-containing protein n=1 Tax=Gymnopus androsaceus JB14 TaxID=1447944 RepID=A0A6A4GW29_9AGAR|nr:hypothetical protein BT96DRAFT_946696 [Gymnopus androsaceus JB14]